MEKQQPPQKPKQSRFAYQRTDVYIPPKTLIEKVAGAHGVDLEKEGTPESDTASTLKDILKKRPRT